jgi:SAM-dependent methyltransferase
MTNEHSVESFSTVDLTAELALFDTAAKGWKSYWASFVRPFVRGRVLEVGAGNGGSISYLQGDVTDWLCLEPDPGFAAKLRQEIESGALPSFCRIQTSILGDLPLDQRFDTILYIDVMEHLAEDGREAALAAKHLASGGTLVILSPAHPLLYSPFDKAVGHYRRYTRRSLAAIIPPSLERVRLIYLDSVGMLLSLGNRFVLRNERASEASIRFWNDWIVPVSRQTDKVLAYSVGKTVLGIWRNPTRRDSAGY